ncbi:MAG TPA: hypothetical protein VG758_01745 [Hyphomicrobiaceae bacterium]|jgi:hypothetical protein|nr:hypothetical protein [Hyphomicrobiaceae bacterium]
MDANATTTPLVDIVNEAKVLDFEHKTTVGAGDRLSTHFSGSRAGFPHGVNSLQAGPVARTTHQPCQPLSSLFWQNGTIERVDDCFIPAVGWR